MKKMTYKFNLNYLKDVDQDIDIEKTTKEYAKQMLEFLKIRFKYHNVKVQAVKQDHDGELHDVSFDCDSRQEEIQTTSMVRSHITTMFKSVNEWVVFKKGTQKAADHAKRLEEILKKKEEEANKPVVSVIRAEDVPEEMKQQIQEMEQEATVSEEVAQVSEVPESIKNHIKESTKVKKPRAKKVVE